MWADNGAYTGKSQAILGAASVRHDALYKYPCVRGDSTLVYTNLVPTGAFRGFGNPSADWAVEQAWDLAAEKLGIDVVDLLRMNAVGPGDHSPHNHKITSCELVQCIDKAVEMIGWRAKRRARAPDRETLTPNPSPERRGEHRASPDVSSGLVMHNEPARDINEPARGLGMGCSVHVNGRRSFGDWDGSAAIVKINEDGRATVITGEGEIGQGNLTVLRQIAAEELGLPYDDVDITRPDTDLQPHSLGALASRLTYVAGNAVKRAAAEAAKQLLKAASEQMKRPPEELTVINGQVGPRNGSETDFKAVGAVVRANIYRPDGQPIIGVGNFDNPSEFPDHNRYGNESGAYNFIAQAAEVEVDRGTGLVTLLEIASAVDCGTVIHPGMAEGQVQGGVMQGIGLAMIEYFDWYNGSPTDPQLKDYPIPGAALMPKMHIAFVDSYEPSGPFGAKGLGEIGLDAVPAVVANAIADAVGVRITQLPITAEKIHRALHPELYVNEQVPPPAAPKGSAWTRLSAGRPSGARPASPEMLFPGTVEEAVVQFAAGDAAFVCGGTAHALRRERSGYPFAKRLIAIGRIPELNELSVDDGGALSLGAAVNQERLYAEPRIRDGWQAIDDALEAVGHARIRRMITVGGSIGPLIGGFDLPIALLALATRVTVAGPQGRRTLALEEAFEKRFAKDELVVSVAVDKFAPRTGSSFLKYMARAVLEIPTANTAARVTLDEQGRCRYARVVVGAVSWKPIILDLTRLGGKTLDEKLARDAVQNVRELATPMPDVRGSAAYKREMAVEFAARALLRAWRRAYNGAVSTFVSEPTHRSA
jgi:CO/xanthine dehydrogenase FAD-binding subunit